MSTDTKSKHIYNHDQPKMAFRIKRSDIPISDENWNKFWTWWYHPPTKEAQKIVSNNGSWSVGPRASMIDTYSWAEENFLKSLETYFKFRHLVGIY